MLGRTKLLSDYGGAPNETETFGTYKPVDDLDAGLLC